VLMHIDATFYRPRVLRPRAAGRKTGAGARRKYAFQEITPRRVHHCLTFPELCREYSSRVRERQLLDVSCAKKLEQAG